MSGSTQLIHPRYRADIDGLRALAVLAVVAFHAFPQLMRGGFIGVDVFFVISGYLISTILFANLENGSFSFVEFYVRRVRRIFPALAIVLLFTCAAGWFLLTADEFRQIGKHVVGGAGFISNFLLRQEAGYFDNSAETKPLLHLWSLGIEEQFYIVWPFLLWFMWKRRAHLLDVAILAAAVSFYLNVEISRTYIVAAFFSPHTRFWELLSGSLLAWVALHKQAAWSACLARGDHWLSARLLRGNGDRDRPAFASLLSGLGLALLLFGFWYIHSQLRFPGFWAVVPVLGTLLVVAAGPQAWPNRVLLASRIAVWIGLISYPLYLWHWPLLSLARMTVGGQLPYVLAIALVPLSVLLAWGTYRLLERPLRFGRARLAKAAVLCIAMAAVGTTGLVIYQANGFDYRRPPNLAWESLGAKLSALGDICALQPLADHPGVLACTFGTKDAARAMVLYGDSHALAISAELDKALQARNIRGIKLELPGCSIVPTIIDARAAPAPTDDCVAHFRSMLGYIAQQKADIVAISRWTFRLYPVAGEIEDMPAVNSEGGIEEESYREYVVSDHGKVSAGASEKRVALEDTIEGLLSTGQKLYLIYPVPEIAWNIARLNYRHYSVYKEVLGEISIPYADFQRRNRFVDHIFDGLLDNPNLVAIRPEQIFCNSFAANRCVAQFDSVPYYFDDDHLSDAGARLVVARIFD